MTRAWISAVALLGGQACIASGLGIDRAYSGTPHPTPAVAQERPKKVGGCIAAYPKGCVPHPNYPQVWYPRDRDRR